MLVFSGIEVAGLAAFTAVDRQVIALANKVNILTKGTDRRF